MAWRTVSLDDRSIFSISTYAFSKLSLKVASKFGSSEVSFSSRCLLACISSCFSKFYSPSEREAVDDVSLTCNRDEMFSHVSFILVKFWILMAILTNVHLSLSSCSLCKLFCI